MYKAGHDCGLLPSPRCQSQPLQGSKRCVGGGKKNCWNVSLVSCRVHLCFPKPFSWEVLSFIHTVYLLCAKYWCWGYSDNQYKAVPCTSWEENAKVIARVMSVTQKHIKELQGRTVREPCLSYEPLPISSCTLTTGLAKDDLESWLLSVSSQTHETTAFPCLLPLYLLKPSSSWPWTTNSFQRWFGCPFCLSSSDAWCLPP